MAEAPTDEAAAAGSFGWKSAAVVAIIGSAFGFVAAETLAPRQVDAALNAARDALGIGRADAAAEGSSAGGATEATAGGRHQAGVQVPVQAPPPAPPTGPALAPASHARDSAAAAGGLGEAELDGSLASEGAAASPAVQSADQQVAALLSQAYNQLAPMLVQGSQLQQVVEERAAVVRNRGEQLLSEEFNAGIADVTEVVMGRRIDPQMLQRTQLMPEDLPSIAQLLGGLIAPVQLQALGVRNHFQLLVIGCFLGVDLLALALDYNVIPPCRSDIFGHLVPFLFPWLTVDAISLSITFAIRYHMNNIVQATLAEVRHSMEERIDLPQDDPARALRLSLERYLINGARAMVAYDRLAKHTTAKVLDGLAIFDFTWQIIGIPAAFGTTSYQCPQAAFRIIAQGRAAAFLIGFIYHLGGIGFSLVKLGINSEAFAIGVVDAAHKLDQAAFPVGPPVFSIFVRSFLVRDASDLRSMELAIARSDQKRARAEQDQRQANLDAARAELQRAQDAVQSADARVVEASSRVSTRPPPEQFMEEYQHNVTALLDQAEFAAHAAEMALRTDLSQVHVEDIGEAMRSAAEHVATAAQQSASAETGGTGAPADAAERAFAAAETTLQAPDG